MKISVVPAYGSHAAPYRRRVWRARAPDIEMSEQSLEVLWDTSTRVVASLRVSQEATLREIHEELVFARPELEHEEFVFLYRGKPVFREFWDVFYAGLFFSTLVIRKGIVVLSMEPSSSVVKSDKKRSKASEAKPIFEDSPKGLKSPFEKSAAKPSESIKKSSAMVKMVPAASKEAQSPVAVPPPLIPLPIASPVASPASAPPAFPPSVPLTGLGISPPATAASYSSLAVSPSSSSSSLHQAAASFSSEEKKDSGDGSSALDAESMASGPPKRAQALYNYKARSADQLSFNKGDFLQILIFRPAGKWWYAKLEDAKGWIPYNFVKLVDGSDDRNDESLCKSKPLGEKSSKASSPMDADVKVLKSHSSSSVKSDSEPTRKKSEGTKSEASFQSVLVPTISSKPDSTEAVVSTPLSESSETSSGDAVGSSALDAEAVASGPPKKAQALYSYKARSADQLSFNKGDLVQILIFRPTGKWWYAKLEDKKGWIPHNFVKFLES